MRRSVNLLLLAALAACPAASWAALTVVQARANHVEPAARFLPGDVLQRVRGLDLAFARCADWRRFELLHLTHRDHVIEGTRDGAPHAWAIREADWQFEFSDGADCTLRAALQWRDFDAAKAAAAALPPETDDHWTLRDRAELLYFTDDLQGAIALLDRLAAIDGLPEEFTAEQELLRSSALRDVGRPADAVAAAEQAVERLSRIAPGSVLHGRAVMARALLATGNERIAALERAIALIEQACGECRELADALHRKGFWLFEDDLNIGREMLELAHRSRSIYERVQSLDPLRFAQRLYGFSHMASLAGDPAAGEAFARASLDRARAAKLPVTTIAEGQAALAVALFHQGRNREAYEAASASVDLHNRNAAGSGEVHKHNAGLILVELGELDAARRAIEDSLAWLSAHSAGSLDEARARRSLARVQELQGDYPAALEQIRRALALEQRGGASGALYANTRLVEGRVLMLAGETAAARAALDDALAAFEAAVDADCVCLGEGLLGAGLLELSQRRAERALALFDRARRIYAKASPGGSAKEGEAWFGVGEAHLLAGAADTALDALHRAVRLLEREAPDQTTLAVALNARARARRSLGNDVEATADYCKAADVLQRAGRRVAEDSMTQAVYRGRHAAMFRECVEATLRHDTPEAALLRLEATRSRALLDSLMTREVDVQTAGAGERSLLTELDTARRERLRIQRRLADPDVPAPDRRRLSAELLALGRTATRALARLQTMAPELAALEGATAASPEPILDGLPEGTVALEYAVGPEDTLMFIASRGAPVQAIALPIGREALERRVRGFRAALLRRDPAGLGALRDEARALHRLLVAPAGERLAGARALIVSPDGPLYDLPFAALSDANAWLGERYPLTLSDSLTTWVRLSRRPPRAASARRLAIADAQAGAASVALPPLPGARTEAEVLRRAAPSITDLLLGADANEPRVRAAMVGPRLLHFAVHALVDADEPLDSGLVLSPGDAGDTRRDGLLRVGEILGDVRVQADLVVLSGCDTARGEALQGEGLIGFSRAFVYAGAGGVMASLWPVSDRATAAFMESFYDAYDGDRSPAVALHAAIKASLAAHAALPAGGAMRGVGGLASAVGVTSSHPYAWAAFQLYGGAR